jgi:hypothetical protein
MDNCRWLRDKTIVLSKQMTDVFIVTSVIHTGTRAWSYTPVRSLFTPEQRLQQTLETIRSIRRCVPGSIIVLVEGGEKCYDELTRIVDHVVDAHNNPDTVRFCLESNNKGLGDAWLLLCGLQFVRETCANVRFVFKLSGRYRLNGQFRLDRFVLDRPTFRRVKGAGCITFCFCVPGSLLPTFITIMENTVRDFQTRLVSIEDYLPAQFSQIHEIDCIGAEGQIAVDKSLRLYSV